jgi:CRISPR system Cascade subunit CasB
MSEILEQRGGGFDNAATLAIAWWRALQPDEGRARPQDRSGDRAALARLRRAGSLAEAMAEEATIDLWRRLAAGEHRRLARIATIAHVLAHVREHVDQTAMRRVGRQRFGDEESAKLKPLRFRRVLAARDDEELMREMRRLVLLADRRLDVGNLAASLLFWRDNRRARWVFDYFAAGRAAPEAATEAAA